jgi:hypothetical protein
VKRESVWKIALVDDGGNQGDLAAVGQFNLTHYQQGERPA